MARAVLVPGVRVTSFLTSDHGSMTQCNQKTGIGGSLNAHHFPGVIDELSIYDHALSAADMKAMFDTDSGG